MKISEKQIIQLINLAQDYSNTLATMIGHRMTSGDAEGYMKAISLLLSEITSQQSSTLREVKE
jgi:hypothetical protein